MHGEHIFIWMVLHDESFWFLTPRQKKNRKCLSWSEEQWSEWETVGKKWKVTQERTSLPLNTTTYWKRRSLFEIKLSYKLNKAILMYLHAKDHYKLFWTREQICALCLEMKAPYMSVNTQRSKGAKKIWFFNRLIFLLKPKKLLTIGEVALLIPQT